MRPARSRSGSSTTTTSTSCRRSSPTRRSRTTTSRATTPARSSARPGSGSSSGAEHDEAAREFVEFLLSEEGQRFYAEEAEEAEYPLIDGVEPKEGLPPLDELEGPDIDLAELGPELEETLELLNEVGFTT